VVIKLGCIKESPGEVLNTPMCMTRLLSGLLEGICVPGVQASGFLKHTKNGNLQLRLRITA